MAWDFSDLTGGNFTLINLVTTTNDASGDLLIAGLIVGVLLAQVMILSFFRVDIVAAFTYSAWASFVYGAFFALAGLLNFLVLLGLLLVAGLGTFYLYAMNK